VKTPETEALRDLLPDLAFTPSGTSLSVVPSPRCVPLSRQRQRTSASLKSYREPYPLSVGGLALPCPSLISAIIAPLVLGALPRMLLGLMAADQATGSSPRSP
jgi:hypothetical protein